MRTLCTTHTQRLCQACARAKVNAGNALGRHAWRRPWRTGALRPRLQRGFRGQANGRDGRLGQPVVDGVPGDAGGILGRRAGARGCALETTDDPPHLPPRSEHSLSTTPQTAIEPSPPRHRQKFAGPHGLSALRCPSHLNHGMVTRQALTRIRSVRTKALVGIQGESYDIMHSSGFANITYRAMCAAGQEVEIHLTIDPSAASIADAWSRLIPTRIDQNPSAHDRRPMDRMRQG